MSKNLINHKDSAENSAATAPEASKDAPKRRKRTVGNIIYDWGVYSSIAWIGVATMSILSAYEASHGNNKAFNWLRNWQNSTSEFISKRLGNGLLKRLPKETVDGYARGTSLFLTLGLGGTTLMAPIKWLEDGREKNAAKIDNALGTTPPNPETIAKEVPQSWKSVITGRLASWGLSYAAFLAMGPKLTSKIESAFGEKLANSWMKLRPKADPVHIRKWSNIGAFDATFTAITAASMYAFSRIVADKDEQKKVKLTTEDVGKIGSPTKANNVLEKIVSNENNQQTDTSTHSFADKVVEQQQEEISISRGVR